MRPGSQGATRRCTTQKRPTAATAAEKPRGILDKALKVALNGLILIAVALALATLGANPKRMRMECALCGARGAALIPSGFACLGCALEAFYEAAEAGDAVARQAVINHVVLFYAVGESAPQIGDKNLLAVGKTIQNRR